MLQHLSFLECRSLHNSEVIPVHWAEWPLGEWRLTGLGWRASKYFWTAKCWLAYWPLLHTLLYQAMPTIPFSEVPQQSLGVPSDVYQPRKQVRSSGLSQQRWAAKKFRVLPLAVGYFLLSGSLCKSFKKISLSLSLTHTLPLSSKTDGKEAILVGFLWLIQNERLCRHQFQLVTYICWPQRSAVFSTGSQQPLEPGAKERLVDIRGKYLKAQII